MTRRTPYTELGIKRVPCLKCGEPSEYQWTICADGNQWRGICKVCDIALNALVLDFFGFRNRRQMIRDYKRRLA